MSTIHPSLYSFANGGLLGGGGGDMIVNVIKFNG